MRSTPCSRPSMENSHWTTFHLGTRGTTPTSPPWDLLATCISTYSTRGSHFLFDGRSIRAGHSLPHLLRDDGVVNGCDIPVLYEADIRQACTGDRVTNRRQGRDATLHNEPTTFRNSSKAPRRAPLSCHWEQKIT